jgi:hypothetical protein
MVLNDAAPTSTSTTRPEPSAVPRLHRRIREICGSRMTTADLAMFLAANTPRIARHELASRFMQDIQRAITDIEHLINRPQPPKTLGPCPTPTGPHHEQCATHLTAPHNTTEIVCPACQQTHNVAQLTERLFQQMHYRTFTIRELLDTVLPRLQEWVPRSTLYDWAAKGKLTSTGHTPDGEALYVLADVRELRSSTRRMT